MDFYQRIAEERIKEAIDRGDLQGLPGEGKPLALEDLSHVPEELRVGYLMLKNAGYVPEEVQLAKETVALQDLLRLARSDGERDTLKRKLSEKQLRLRLMMEQRGWQQDGAWHDYGDRIAARMNEE